MEITRYGLRTAAKIGIGIVDMASSVDILNKIHNSDYLFMRQHTKIIIEHSTSILTVTQRTKAEFDNTVQDARIRKGATNTSPEMVWVDRVFDGSTETTGMGLRGNTTTQRFDDMPNVPAYVEVLFGWQVVGQQGLNSATISAKQLRIYANAVRQPEDIVPA